MQLMICDPLLINPILADRRRRGIDGHDEVWDGVYVIPPILDIEHQGLCTRLGIILGDALGRGAGHHYYCGVNVSDRNEDWLQNVRVPDFAIYLKDSPAIERETHYQGGPDFAVEIVSPGDRSREKLDFYAKVNTREVLIVDRDPWALELYALKGKKLKLVGRSTLEEPDELRSEALDLSLRLVAGTTRPSVEVRRPGRKRPWRA